MAQNKKLSAEIDRTVKKIAEGIELFDSTWEKLHTTSASNQKEKFQGELKTEIKKLQRMRDQIKTWQANSDVRDKRAIDEARRQIEQKMEQFKACEREAKIKTYSKIGLSLPSREDPEEAAREQARSWLRAAIDSLNLQVQALEAECEGVTSKKRKKAVKSSDKSEEKMQEHKFHVGKCEALLRRLDNEQIQPDDLEPIQELIQEYVDHNSDKHYDGTGMEDIYDDLVPEDFDSTFPDTPNQLTIEKTESSQSASKASREEKKRKKKEADESSKASTPTTPSIPNALTTPPAHSLAQEKTATPTAAPATKAASTPTAAPAQKAPQPPATQANYAAAVKNTPAAAAKKGQAPQATPPHQTIDRPTSLPRQSSATEARTAALAAAAPIARAPSKGRDSSAPTSPVTPPVKGTAPRSANNSLAGAAQAVNAGMTPPAPGSKSVPVATPQPAMSDAAKLNFEKMLQQSANNLPIPEDTRKRQPYVPPNPYETPSFYPQQPHEAFQQPETFERFDVDTLFFIFYYQQSTYQQYLAAKELKRQSWRFHKRCWTWFQRHQPPTMVEEEYEQGSYVYFDFEEGWTSRLKDEFTFKYCYLEDELTSA